MREMLYFIYRHKARFVMDALIQSLNKTPGSTVAGLIFVVAVLSVCIVWQFVALRSLRAKWASLMAGSDGVNLEELLQRHFDDRQAVSERLADTSERVEVLERKMRSAKRYVGVVNFDAFSDVGGSQSFSIAVYDEEGNGTVLTSLVGREGCRVYGKCLVNGKPDRLLSKEEEMAIEQATTARSRPRISP